MSRKYIRAKLRDVVAERAGGCCEYCQSQAAYAAHPFEIDHIIPISRGGSTIPDNLALACRGCNLNKHDKIEAHDPVEGRNVPLYNPRHQQWRDHFNWNTDYTHIIGLTATGRATIDALQMNRQSLANMRQALVAVQKHPPDLDEVWS